jgi:hypothetical protein
MAPSTTPICAACGEVLRPDEAYAFISVASGRVRHVHRPDEPRRGCFRKAVGSAAVHILIGVQRDEPRPDD